MLNHVVLVGRLTNTPEVKVLDNGKKRSSVVLAVPRNYKNSNGEYETDFVDCVLWTTVAENTAEYCKVGDMIGVKGRLQSRYVENPEGVKKKKTEVVAERITFLSSARSKEE